MLRLISVIIMTSVMSVSSFAATLYVETTGDDADPCTLAEPCETVQRGHDAASNGDTISIGNGTFTESVTVSKSGLTFDGASTTKISCPTGASSPEGFDLQATADDITIRDIEISDCDEAIFIRSGSSGAIIRNMDIHDNMVLRIQGDDVRLKDSDIYDHTGNGVLVDNGGNNVRMTNLSVYGHADDGISGDDDADNLQVTDTEVYDNGEDGIDIQGYRPRLTRVTVHGNLRGVRCWNDRCKVVSSLIYGNDNVGMTLSMLFGPTNGKIELYNNTIVNGTRAMQASGNKLWRLIMTNNIMVADNPQGKVVEWTDCMDVDESYNNFHRATDTADHVVIVPATCGSSTVRYSGQEIEDGDYEDETDWGLGTRAVDPDFVNASADDYDLASTSVLIDAGTDFTLLPDKDIESEDRNQGTAPDMGAYEQ